MRFSEEVLLLREEMRRVLEFLKWQENWWMTQGTRRTGLQATVAEGLLAYAQKQAYYRRALHDKFDHTWRYSAEFCALGIGAENEILDLEVAANYPLAALSEVDDSTPLLFPNNMSHNQRQLSRMITDYREEYILSE